MLSFESDYVEGCHEKILKRLMETNLEKQPGYGEDEYTEQAKEKIKKALECEEARVYLLSGGTQTNQIVIDTMLSAYEGVVAAKTGHIAAHEAGAIEFTGHKVLTLPQTDGKLFAKDLKELLRSFYADASYEHMVFPGMVYLSHPTEYGTLYTAKELSEISEVCHEYGIPLFLDGARLGYGLMSEGTDVTLPLIAKLTDVFYIGGTKVGALLGEAVVFTKNNMPKHFLTRVKQHGALLAKGRVLGVQFDTLFTDGLYFEISKHAIRCAERLREVFRENGVRFFLETTTNQIFVILENDVSKRLSEKVRLSEWEPYDEHHTVYRFATDWATTMEDIEAFAKLLHAEMKR